MNRHSLVRFRRSLCFGLLALGASSMGLRASEHVVVGQSTQVLPLPLGQLELSETTVQVGELAINRFGMHRLRRPNFAHRGVLLLMPSLGNSFDMYLVDENGDPTRSFAAFFARLGYDVWGYSPRTTGIAPGACSNGLDCTPILGWNLQTTVDDAAWIRAQIELAAPGALPMIGGLSLGAISALAVIDAAPTAYAALLAWEGSLVTDDPTIQAHALTYYAQLDAMLGAGIAVDDQSLPFVKLVAELARVAPDDLFAIPVPGFPPGLTNHQAFVLILSSPNPIAPSPRPGFLTAAGDFLADQLFFSDEQRLFANIAVFDDVTANGVTRDLYGSLAGVVTTYVDNLASFTGPVMIIKAGQGFGSIMDELPGKLGSSDVTFLALEGFAHIDHFGSPAHRLVLEFPIALWLGTSVFP
jgi:hypothetical protein